MPTKKIDGFEIVVNTRGEHPPPHAHVYKAEHVVVINLGDKTTLPSIDTSKPTGMSKSDVRKALDYVTDEKDWCLSQWRVPQRNRHDKTPKKSKRRRV